MIRANEPRNQADDRPRMLRHQDAERCPRMPTPQLTWRDLVPSSDVRGVGAYIGPDRNPAVVQVTDNSCVAGSIEFLVVVCVRVNDTDPGSD